MEFQMFKEGLPKRVLALVMTLAMMFSLMSGLGISVHAAMENHDTTMNPDDVITDGRFECRRLVLL